MKKILFTILFGIIILSPLHVSAAGTGIDSAMSQLILVNNTTGLKSDLPATLGTVISTALSLIGTIFLGLMIYAGILWMTAMGKEEKVEKAKDIVTAAIIGLALTMSAYAITFFVTNKLTTVGGGGGGGAASPAGSGGAATFTSQTCEDRGGVCMSGYSALGQDIGTYDSADPCDPNGTTDILTHGAPLGICGDKSECCELEASEQKCDQMGGDSIPDEGDGCGATNIEIGDWDNDEGEPYICCKDR